MIEDNESLLGQMRNGTWLDSQEFPPLEWTVPGVIPEGFGLLCAPPKAGKSWLVAGIGLACASGGLALGRVYVKQRPVFYMALEDGDRRLQSRFRKLMGGELLPEQLHYITKALPIQVPGMLYEFLDRFGDQKPLMVLDTLGRARGTRPAGSDSYQMDYALGAQLKGIVDSVPGSSLVVVHHTRKAESPDFVDAVSGTQGTAGAADFIMILSRKRHSEEAVLAVTGRDVTEAEYALCSDDGLWRLDGADLTVAASVAERRRDSGKLGDRSLEVLAVVNERVETRAADLVGIGIDQEQGRVYLNRLADSGRIEKVGRGLYKGVTTVMSVMSDESALFEEPSDDENVTVITDVTPSRQDAIATKLASMGGVR